MEPLLTEPGRFSVPTILLVEEDETLLESLRQAFKNTRYMVLCANSSIEAIGLWDDNGGNIHTLVTQLEMRSVSGIQLAETLRKENGFLRVLFLCYSRNDLPKGLEIPQSAFLEKPFLIADLFHKLEDMFRR